MQLTAVQGPFEIRNCPLLENLNGLNNITYAGNDALDGFILRDLPLLNDLTALSNLDSVTGEFTIRTCDIITNLNGLDGFTKAKGSVIIRDNILLQSLDGLSGLNYIGETLELVGNIQLSNISALSNVNTIIGGVEGGVFIMDNTILSDLTGLGNNTTTIGSNLDLVNNGSLTICSVPSICNYLNNPPAGAIITINTNLTGCNSEIEILANCDFSLIDENSHTSPKYTVYPNPANDYLIIQSITNSEFSVELYSVNNSPVMHFAKSTQYLLDISSLPSGIHLIKCTDQYGSFKLIKFIRP